MYSNPAMSAVRRARNKVEQGCNPKPLPYPSTGLEPHAPGHPRTVSDDGWRNNSYTRMLEDGETTRLLERQRKL